MVGASPSKQLLHTSLASEQCMSVINTPFITCLQPVQCPPLPHSRPPFIPLACSHNQTAALPFKGCVLLHLRSAIISAAASCRLCVSRRCMRCATSCLTASPVSTVCCSGTGWRDTTAGEAARFADIRPFQNCKASEHQPLFRLYGGSIRQCQSPCWTTFPWGLCTDSMYSCATERCAFQYRGCLLKKVL